MRILKENKGITLVALVITIIMLLILAGVTLSLVLGDNGIITKADEASGINAYIQAEEQVKLAYMAVKTEIESKKTDTKTYKATEDREHLKQIVEDTLVGNEWNIKLNGDVIKIKYKNLLIKKGIVDQDPNKPLKDGRIDYKIELYPEEAKLLLDTIIYMRDGTEVEIPEVGDDVEIGEERFKVIKKSSDGKKITTIPYYNLVLKETPVKQANAENANSAGTIMFSGPIYWKKEDKNIPMDEGEEVKRNNVQEYIEKYQKYLNTTLGASNAVAKIGRWVKTAETAEEEYIGNLSGLNPSGIGRFWYGTCNYNGNIAWVRCSDNNASQWGNISLCYSNSCGIRPLIIITL